MFLPPATESKDKLENCRVGFPTVHGYHDGGWVHGMDTMGQLLKENYNPLKRIFWGFGVKLLVRTSYSSQCSSFYLCHWQRYVTFNMWVTRVTTVVTIVQGFLVTIEPEHCWSELCQNLFGDNCVLRAKATTVRVYKGEKRVSNRWWPT